MSKSIQQTKYEYLAFISYQRKDETVAKRLQHTLEFYNLPIAVINKHPEYPELKDGIRPIFVDMTELGNEPFLKPAIEKALKESRFLIVICSPRSAKSKWVNKEVQYFLQLKRTKRIIPFIIDGTPNAILKDEECCTPLLKKLLGKRELLGLNINEMGFDAAAVKVVSRMFHIGFRSLWNRFEKEKEKEQRKLKEQNDRLLIAQSRFVAEKAEKLIDDGNSYLARRLLLEVLDQTRPYVVEAESALRKAVLSRSGILSGHTSYTSSAFFSPNGKFVVSASNDKSVRIWDAETGQQIGLPLNGHKFEVTFASFSPDGKRIVSASEDHIRIWDVETRQCLQTMEGKGQMGWMSTAFFSPDGKRILSAFFVVVCIWDVETGRQIGQQLKGHTYFVTSASFSPDGKRIVSASYDKTIRIWNAQTGKQIGNPLEGHTDVVTSAAFSPDGKRIVSASYDKTIRIWDAETGQQIGKPLEGHTDFVLSASFSPDGKRIVSASRDNTIRIWDAETGICIRIIEGHSSSVQYASFSPDGKRVVSASDDNTIRVWDVEIQRQIGLRLKGNIHIAVSSTFLSPDSKQFVTMYENAVHIFDIETGECLRILKGHTNSVNSVSFDPMGKRIISASDDNTIRIWDVQTGKQIGDPLEGHTWSVNSASFSPDGKRIVSASRDKTIRIWDAQTGKQIGDPLEGLDDDVAAFSLDGKRIVSASGDSFGNHTICIWDSQTGTQIGDPLEGRADWVTSASFSPDGKCIVLPSWEIVRVWDLETGQQIGGPLKGHTSSVKSAAFSPDGKRIVSASDDNSIRIWDVNTWQQIGLPLEGHTKPVTSANFSSDGKRIVSTSLDQTIRIWDAETGRQIGYSLDGHTFYHKYALFSHDGRHIVSVSNGGTVSIWDFPPLQELIDETRERFKNRSLTDEERRKYYLE